MALEGGQHGRHLVAEGNRHRLLQIAAAGHRRVAVFPGEFGECVADAVDVLLDDFERFADLHDRGGVGDVLGGGAPVRPFAEPVLAKLHKLLDDRQHRIADPLGRFLEFRHVDLVGRAMANDFRSRFLRDDAELGLRERKRRLEIEIFLHAVFVREHIPHCFGGEYVAEHRGIEDRRGHSVSPVGRTLAFPVRGSTRDAAECTGCADRRFSPK